MVKGTRATIAVSINQIRFFNILSDSDETVKMRLGDNETERKQKTLQ